NSYILQFLIWAGGLSLTIWLFIDYSINSSLLFNLFVVLAFIFLGVNLLKNIYSGFLIYINKTFKIGDTIQLDGKVGVVSRIGIRSVHIRTPDQIEMIIPHSRILEETISVISDKVESKSVEFTIEIGELDSGETLKKLRYACYSSPYLDYTKPVDVFVDKIDTHDQETVIRIKVYVFDGKYSSALKSDIIKNTTDYLKRNRKSGNEIN
ncbi:MAG: mechanosensitive ion channel, partial [Calditrichaeota bacterium]|nr:mechanosensitive ion channel [Calditrichota bacterium]